MSFLNEFTTVCGNACTTGITFPAAVENPDCVPELLKSQIGDLVIVPEGATDPFGASWTGEGATIAYTADSIDNTAIDNTKSRRFRGIGSLSEKETTFVPGPYDMQIPQRTVTNLEFTIQNVATENRAFWRAMECSPTNFTAYLGTETKFFGKSGGVKLKNVVVQMPLGAGPDDFEQIILRAEIETNRVSLERAENNPFN
ncbi:hypothetical protein [Lewinella sp. W8]|uniref:hypothetical protein n=1 Tax=Lewinella sp. W8 TaxID=2528208 RepID=UPI0010687762|nr:hypothetical protein [Lewinella sp. W8]MTB53039.1 hypothetical protein [Lewinella sp. W8]